METAIQKQSLNNLKLFDTTKAQRTEFVNEIIEALDEGIIDPLEIHLQLEAMENIIDQLTSTDEKKNKNIAAAIRYRQLLLEAAEKHHTKSFEFHSAKFTISETGTKYDYSNCGDDAYFELVTQRNELDEKIKAREKFLQTVPTSGLLVTNEDTGELSKVYPPSKKSTTSISVSLK